MLTHNSIIILIILTVIITILIFTAINNSHQVAPVTVDTAHQGIGEYGGQLLSPSVQNRGSLLSRAYVEYSADPGYCWILIAFTPQASVDSDCRILTC